MAEQSPTAGADQPPITGAAAASQSKADATKAAAAAAALFLPFLHSVRLGDTSGAADVLRDSLRDHHAELAPPARILLQRAIEWARRSSRTEAYADNADAFELFIDHGGNIGLYNAVRDALAPRYERAAGNSGGDGVWTLLDIGCGSGRGVAPALEQCCPTKRPLRVDAVDPTADMLRVGTAKVSALLQERPGDEAKCVPHNATLQQFQASEDASGPSRRSWTACQATFSMHNLSPAERAPRLRWLAERTQTLWIVEFDVPKVLTRAAGVDAAGEAARAKAVFEAYARGVAEYLPPALPEAAAMRVLDGFLVPILMSSFANEGKKAQQQDVEGAADCEGDDAAADTQTTFEQTAEEWAAELKQAGFRSVSVHRLFPYWWADAVLIEGSHGETTTVDAENKNIRNDERPV